jgi:gas vesicle protein
MLSIVYKQKENGMSNESSAGEKALYLMLGATIGAVAALLLAPRSGMETRRLIASKAREGADYVASRTKAVAEKTSEIVDRGKEVFQQQRNSVSAAVDAGKQAYREEKNRA